MDFTRLQIGRRALGRDGGHGATMFECERPVRRSRRVHVFQKYKETFGFSQQVRKDGKAHVHEGVNENNESAITCLALDLKNTELIKKAKKKSEDKPVDKDK